LAGRQNDSELVARTLAGDEQLKNTMGGLLPRQLIPGGSRLDDIPTSNSGGEP
jgi:hypothetical protein